MLTGSVKAEGGVPSNLALAAEVTEGCPLPLGMAMGLSLPTHAWCPFIRHL